MFSGIFSLRQQEIHTVRMTVLDDSHNSFLSPYCGDEPIINSEVADFINHACKSGHPGKRITLQIAGNEITPKEEIEYASAIHNYYRAEAADLARQKKRVWFTAGTLAMLGALVFAFILTIPAIGENRVLNEILDIVGWVLVWEAVDQFLFERNRLRLEHLLAVRLQNAIVLFVPLSSGKKKDTP